MKCRRFQGQGLAVLAPLGARCDGENAREVIEPLPVQLLELEKLVRLAHGLVEPP